jgi:hypothetical protein
VGEWREHASVGPRAGEVHCDLCGRLLPRRAWLAEVNGENHRFCDPECAALYREYRLPGHAPEAQ